MCQLHNYCRLLIGWDVTGYDEWSFLKLHKYYYFHKTMFLQTTRFVVSKHKHVFKIEVFGKKTQYTSNTPQVLYIQTRH
jgi:hypothetical protein